MQHFLWFISPIDHSLISVSWELILKTSPPLLWPCMTSGWKMSEDTLLYLIYLFYIAMVSMSMSFVQSNNEIFYYNDKSWLLSTQSNKRRHIWLQSDHFSGLLLTIPSVKFTNDHRSGMGWENRLGIIVVVIIIVIIRKRALCARHATKTTLPTLMTMTSKHTLKD